MKKKHIYKDQCRTHLCPLKHHRLDRVLKAQVVPLLLIAVLEAEDAQNEMIMNRQNREVLEVVLD